MIEAPFDEIKILARTFPRLFGQRETANSYVSNGWLPILTRLLIDLDVMLDDDHAAQFRILQIKEKFGALRFYWSLGGERSLIADIHAVPRRHIEIVPSKPSALFAACVFQRSRTVISV